MIDRKVGFAPAVTTFAVAVLTLIAFPPAARSQSSAGTQLVVQMQDGVKHQEHTFNWRITPDTVDLGREKYDRPAVRIVCARLAVGDQQRECDRTYPTLPGTQDVIVWKNRSHTVGHIEGVGCNYDDCVVSQKGLKRSWNDVDYVQFAPAAPVGK